MRTSKVAVEADAIQLLLFYDSIDESKLTMYLGPATDQIRSVDYLGNI